MVEQVNGSNPKPPQRFAKVAFLHWAARLKEKSGAEVHAVYEACGFGFGLQRNLTALEQSRLELGCVAAADEAGSARPVISFWCGGPMGRCRLPHPVLQDKCVGEHNVGLDRVATESAVLRG